MATTRLKKSQVARGIGRLRDVAAAEHLTPIIYTYKDGYVFSDEPADWIEYEKKQFRQILGRLTRVITGTLDPHLARCPEDEWAQLAIAQLTGVRGRWFSRSQPGQVVQRPPARPELSELGLEGATGVDLVLLPAG